MKIPRFQLAHRGSVKQFRRMFQHLIAKYLVTLVLLAIRAAFVAFNFDQGFQSLLILSRSISSGIRRSSRHFGRLRCCFGSLERLNKLIESDIIANNTLPSFHQPIPQTSNIHGRPLQQLSSDYQMVFCISIRSFSSRGSFYVVSLPLSTCTPHQW